MKTNIIATLATLGVLMLGVLVLTYSPRQLRAEAVSVLNPAKAADREGQGPTRQVPVQQPDGRLGKGFKVYSPAMNLPEELKGKIAVGNVAINGEASYGVPLETGVSLCVRLNYPLKNLTGQPLHVLVYYVTESKVVGGIRGNACYRLGAGEERTVDILFPLPATDGSFSLELRMLPLDRPPTKQDRGRQVVLVDPLPIGIPALPKGTIAPNKGASAHFELRSVQLVVSNQVNCIVATVLNNTGQARPLGMFVGVNDYANCSQSGRKPRPQGLFRRHYTTVAARGTGQIVMPWELLTTGPRPLLAFQLFEPLQGIPDLSLLNRDYAMSIGERDLELIAWGAVDLAEAAQAGECVLTPPPPAEERAKLTGETRSDHFVFRYRPGSTAERDIEKIIQQCEATYAWLSGLFKMELPGPVQMDLYPDIEAKGLGSGSGWNIANTVNASQVAEVYNEMIPGSHGHEIAHIFSYRFPGYQHRGGAFQKPGNGFVEGFAACFQSKEAASGALASVRARAGTETVPPIPEIIAAPGPGAGAAQIALVDFLVRKDPEKFKAFYVQVIAHPDTKTIEQASKETYSASLSGLEKEWQTHLQPQGIRR